MAIARETIDSQEKELKKKVEDIAQAKQAGYDVGVKETEDALRAQVTEVCRGYSLQVQTEALNLARMDASSELRKTQNIFYPLALQKIAQPTSKETTAPKALLIAQPTDTIAATSEPTKEIEAKHSNPPPAATEAESSNPPRATTNNPPP